MRRPLSRQVVRRRDLVMRFALVAVLLAACGRAAVMDFEFQAAGGQPVYRSTSLRRTLQRDVASGIQPVVVLIETPSFNDARYRQQMVLVESLQAEDQLLLVAACTCGTYASGYSTTAETAKRIARGVQRFHVTLLDGGGVVLRESDTVLPPSEIEAVARQRMVNGAPPNKRLQWSAAAAKSTAAARGVLPSSAAAAEPPSR
jgi:hypothetical protein